MNKVILLVLLMPVTAFGQIIKNYESGDLSSRIRSQKDDLNQDIAYPGDVIISEIMADPSPAVSLPAKEYIEIYNRTQYSFNLKNWRLSDDNTTSTFPEKIIPPGSYMILCQIQDTSLFKIYGETTGLRSFPALTNSGKIIFMSDESGKLIHGIKYSDDWYEDVLKDEGGWSLEIIDTEYPFYEQGNWHASLSKDGGTPGKTNSVSAENPDNIFSGIENAFPVDSKSVRIEFSETLIDLDKKIQCIKIENSEITDLVPSDPLMRSYIANIRNPILGKTIYNITIGDEAIDFAGNRMQRNEFSFGIPEQVQKGDILFNELLFNPFPGEPDYIEFYNPSQKIINASDLILVSVNDEFNDTSSVVFLLPENRCIIPCNYIVITSDKNALLDRFFSSEPERIFEISNLPSMPDEMGHLILYDRELEKIDEVFYDEGMHYSLLHGNEGISLEKVRTESPSTDRTLWHSASEISGWGTPGLPNSVLFEHQVSKDRIVLSSTRITPDNDGYEDLLVIDLKLTGIGNVVSVVVFDETGSFVKKLANNVLAGSEASVVWNGTAEDEKLVDTGIYIILVTVFDDMGKVQKWKRICTVIRK